VVEIITTERCALHYAEAHFSYAILTNDTDAHWLLTAAEVALNTKLHVGALELTIFGEARKLLKAITNLHSMNCVWFICGRKLPPQFTTIWNGSFIFFVLLTPPNYLGLLALHQTDNWGTNSSKSVEHGGHHAPTALRMLLWIESFFFENLEAAEHHYYQATMMVPTDPYSTLGFTCGGNKDPWMSR